MHYSVMMSLPLTLIMWLESAHRLRSIQLIWRRSWDLGKRHATVWGIAKTIVTWWRRCESLERGRWLLEHLVRGSLLMVLLQLYFRTSMSSSHMVIQRVRGNQIHQPLIDLLELMHHKFVSPFVLLYYLHGWNYTTFHLGWGERIVIERVKFE